MLRGVKEPSHTSPKGSSWKKGEGLFPCRSGCEVKTKLMLTGSKLRYPSPQGHPCDLQTDSTLSLVPGSGQVLDRFSLASSETSPAHSWAPGFWLENHKSHFLFLIPGWVAWVPQPWELGGLVMPVFQPREGLVLTCRREPGGCPRQSRMGKLVSQRPRAVQLHHLPQDTDSSLGITWFQGAMGSNPLCFL